MYRILTRLSAAMLGLVLSTGCATQLHQHPATPSPAASQLACTGWTGAAMAWPMLANLIAAELEQQRLAACIPPPAPPASPPAGEPGGSTM